MREKRITTPELALVAGTRMALGAGLGLLLADRLNDDQRRAAGWSLLLVGALTTIPLAIEVLGKDTNLSAGNQDEGMPFQTRKLSPQMAHATGE